MTALSLCSPICKMGNHTCFAELLGKIKNTEVRVQFITTLAWETTACKGEEGEEDQPLHAFERPQRDRELNIIILLLVVYQQMDTKILHVI